MAPQARSSMMGCWFRPGHHVDCGLVQLAASSTVGTWEVDYHWPMWSCTLSKRLTHGEITHQRGSPDDREMS